MNRRVSESDPNYRSNYSLRRKRGRNKFTAIPTVKEESTKARPAKKSKSSDPDFVVNLNFCYRIIEFVTVFSAIADIVVCKRCKQKLSFGQSGDVGLGFKISIKCTCGTTLINSGPSVNRSFEINRRVVFAMRLLGIARDGINLFCGIMDLGQGLSKLSYEIILRRISEATSKIFDFTCKKAVEEEKQLNYEKGESASKIIVTGDSSWKKRGPVSLFEVTSLTACRTGKVIDVGVKNHYCRECTCSKCEEKSQLSGVKESCQSNRDSGAGRMEVNSVLKMFHKSLERYGVTYYYYNGCSDPKPLQAILDMQPYEDVLRDNGFGLVLGGYWPDPNESFNAIVWRLAPENLSCGLKIIELAAFLAAGMHNEGYNFILQIMNELRLEIGLQCKYFADTYDMRCVRRNKRRSLVDTQESKTPREETQADLLDGFEEDAVLLYGFDIADLGGEIALGEEKTLISCFS